jgi:AraC-like DNA-binding protein
MADRPTELIVDTGGVSAYSVRCDGDERGWTAEEEVMTFALILVARGMFRRRARATEESADLVTGYLQVPTDAQQIAHPAGGDVCTVIVPTASGFGDLADPRAPIDPAFHVPVLTGLNHRVLLARWRGGADAFELGERAIVLAGSILERPEPAPRRASALDRRLASRVRDALQADMTVTLDELARGVDTSVYRLSRAFRRVIGLTVTRYRSELRIARALELLADGDELAGVAADAGFSDQAHLTRSLREQTGLTPKTARRVLDRTGASRSARLAQGLLSPAASRF